MTNDLRFLINPFQIKVDPIERLLMISFEKDPDSRYNGFEIQYVNDHKVGKGHLIIAWRRDGQVDVYHQPDINIKEKHFNSAGRGLCETIRCMFDVSSFDITSKGVQALYRFNDKYGRNIKIKINEKNHKKREPFNILAPMGANASNPSSFPLVMLYDFYFVRRKQTVIEVDINSRLHKTDNLPVLINGSAMSAARYSPRPLMVDFNPSADDYIPVLKLRKKQLELLTYTEELFFEWTGQGVGIKHMRNINGVCPLTLSFAPAFPDVITMKPNQFFEGTFEISCDKTAGVISGQYRVTKKNQLIKIKCIPSGGWSPVADRLALKFLFRTTPVYKDWPKTYEWTAYITERDQDNYYIHSWWKRTKRQ
ncbi:hypothetical protein ADIAL_1577 [Alkalibacterium sp. AK22]|uniref:hypothetical protein n=1 Tax=Alkalibacterium sp. AK22 TaxID=1229520 RepID=UPI000449B9BF|nr:hypothetical protein [Alkalibacterium sp. AK22]EXJ22954.1 hypothetical protein ADIAL_1577 [Alkalibacterium sp. AK22]